MGVSVNVSCELRYDCEGEGGDERERREHERERKSVRECVSNVSHAEVTGGDCEGRWRWREQREQRERESVRA